MTSAYTDAQLLDMLHRKEFVGDTATDIADRMGITRSAVMGHIRRIREAHKAVPCECTKAENKDGGMPVKWWAA